MTRPRGPGAPPLALIFAISGVGILTSTLIGSSIPDILAGLDVDKGAAGPLVASGTVAGIAMAPIVGSLADRFGRRPAVTACLAAFGVFGMLQMAAPNYPVMLALRVAQGFGSAGLMAFGAVLVGDHFAGVERTRRMGQNAAAFAVSTALAPVVGGFLTDTFGWRWSTAPYGLAVPLALWAWLVLPPGRPAPAAGATPTEPMSAYLRRPPMPLVLAAAVGYYVLMFGLVVATLPGFLDDRFALAASTRGLVMSLASVAGAVAALRFGSLRARAAWPRVATLALGLFAVALVTVAFSPWLGLAVVGVVAWGAADSVMFPTLQEVATGSAPAAARGRVVTGLTGFIRTGQTLGPLLAGVLIGRQGAVTTFEIGAVAGVVFLVMFGLAARSPARVLAPE